MTGRSQCGRWSKSTNFKSMSQTLETHGHHQVVDRGLGDVVLFFQQSHLKLPAVLGNWNPLADRPIQNILKMLDRWHVWWIQWPLEDRNTLVRKEVPAHPGNVWAGIILLEGQMIEFNKGRENWLQHFISAMLSIQVAVNEMQKCALSIANACT